MTLKRVVQSRTGSSAFLDVSRVDGEKRRLFLVQIHEGFREGEKVTSPSLGALDYIELAKGSRQPRRAVQGNPLLGSLLAPTRTYTLAEKTLRKSTCARVMPAALFAGASFDHLSFRRLWSKFIAYSH